MAHAALRRVVAFGLLSSFVSARKAAGPIEASASAACSPGDGCLNVGSERRLGSVRYPRAVSEIVLELVRLIEEELEPFKRDAMLKRNISNDRRRIEQPETVVLPEVDVIGEVLRDATAQ